MKFWIVIILSLCVLKSTVSLGCGGHDCCAPQTEQSTTDDDTSTDDTCQDYCLCHSVIPTLDISQPTLVLTCPYVQIQRTDVPIYYCLYVHDYSALSWHPPTMV